ncbi:MAG: hypothetical protein BGP24_21445 [Lysobacterales bacterium 69-70]|nr:hypothetical protein [Xanthomonadaceae bacterium]ODU36338.1 MAG: hypothetical protein ABS97_00165 [Xanthomonadaceae bacterium SCN 69-320]ODV21684.1 MAG: hypothetical protein ABT27_03820 [Xanthomonadaceae bacterium SCN 69-25]OJY95885.1 MAG: hypothetical protein BGP24_21445 [Xanthomonadales bacterium 69-70]
MSLRHRLLALLPLALLAAGSAEAGRLVDLQIVDRESGTPLQQYPYRGDSFVAGAPGHRYAVRLTNRGNERVLAVLSVDGVNVISGEAAATAQTGYVLDPYETTEVAGWRKNMNEIAAFEFTSLSESYAAQTGRPGNVGIIGMAVFRERNPRPVFRSKIGAASEGEAKRAPELPPAAAPSSSAGAAQDSMARRESAPVQESLGTGHGQREDSDATYTTFRRASDRPAEIASVRYDSWRNLVARGVIPRPRPQPDRPDPFPGNFVPDPPVR